MRKDIDLRIEAEGEPTWVLFLGRKPDVMAGSFAGHAFVGFGREDNAQQMSWQEGFGLYPQSSPAGGASIIIGKVPGKIVKEANNLSDIIISCRVSRSQFDAVMKLKELWGSKPDYQLIYQDCVTFTLAAAGVLGLKLPARQTFPDTISLPITHMEGLAVNSTEDFPYGDWISADAGQRWRLLLNLNDGKWIEKATTGATLEAPTRVTRISEHRFRIERDNNANVLTFLGARESVLQALLEKGLRPSYMILDRTGPSQFQAQWFGLRWSLDAQNNLKTVTQPGDAAGAAYVLNRKT